MFGLSLVTAPTKEPLSLTEAKRHLRVADEVSQDNEYITALIMAAREYAESYTNRQLLTATWDLTIDRFPRHGNVLHLPKAPLQSVTSITYLNELGVSTVWTSSEYRVQALEPARISLGYDEEYPDVYGVNGQITIRFVAGYGVDPSDVPMTIRQAMLLLIGHWYTNREEVGRVGDRVEVAAHALLGMHRYGDQFMNYGVAP